MEGMQKDSRKRECKMTVESVQKILRCRVRQQGRNGLSLAGGVPGERAHAAQGVVGEHPPVILWGGQALEEHDAGAKAGEK